MFFAGWSPGLGNNAVIAVQLNWGRWKSVDKKRHHICRAVKRGASKKEESGFLLLVLPLQDECRRSIRKCSCAGTRFLKVDLIGDSLQALEGVHTNKKIVKKQIGTPTASEWVVFDCKGKTYYLYFCRAKKPSSKPQIVKIINKCRISQKIITWILKQTYTISLKL